MYKPVLSQGTWVSPPQEHCPHTVAKMQFPGAHAGGGTTTFLLGSYSTASLTAYSYFSGFYTLPALITLPAIPQWGQEGAAMLYLPGGSPGRLI